MFSELIHVEIARLNILKASSVPGVELRTLQSIIVFLKNSYRKLIHEYYMICILQMRKLWARKSKWHTHGQQKLVRGRAKIWGHNTITKKTNKQNKTNKLYLK